MQTHLPLFHRWASRLLILALALAWTAGCRPAGAQPAIETPAAGDTLVFLTWNDYIPPRLLDEFTRQTGIRVELAFYSSYEEAVARIINGDAIDLAVLSPDMVVGLIATGKLSPIRMQNVPNFRNVSANFRNLVYDPENRYTVPFVWGSTGLLVRTDLAPRPITHWADLWDPQLSGRVAYWEISNDLIPIALKSLGYSANSEDPAELEEALQRLLVLKQHARSIPGDEGTVIPYLERGDAVVAVCWAYDALLAQDSPAPMRYVLPEDGTILWSEVLVAPSGGKNRLGAERLINLMLQGDMGALITEQTGYAVPNDLAHALLPAEIIDNPLIFPPLTVISKAEVLLPHSPTAQALYDAAWERFLAGK